MQFIVCMHGGVIYYYWKILCEVKGVLYVEVRLNHSSFYVYIIIGRILREVKDQSVVLFYGKTLRWSKFSVA